MTTTSPSNSDDDPPVAAPRVVSIAEAKKPRRRAPPWLDGAISDDRGRILPILRNAALALRAAPELKDAFRFDELQRLVIVEKPLPLAGGAEPRNTSHPRPLSDGDVSQVQEWLQNMGVPKIGREVMGQAIELRAQERSFNPVRDYLDPLKWDGVNRLSPWMVARRWFARATCLWMARRCRFRRRGFRVLRLSSPQTRASERPFTRRYTAPACGLSCLFSITIVVRSAAACSLALRCGCKALVQECNAVDGLVFAPAELCQQAEAQGLPCLPIPPDFDAETRLVGVAQHMSSGSVKLCVAAHEKARNSPLGAALEIKAAAVVDHPLTEALITAVSLSLDSTGGRAAA